MFSVVISRTLTSRGLKVIGDHWRGQGTGTQRQESLITHGSDTAETNDESEGGKEKALCLLQLGGSGRRAKRLSHSNASLLSTH